MEKTCKQCGRTMPLEMFSKRGIYYLNKCKDCANEARRERSKRHGRSDEEKAKDTLRCALYRERLKSDTGRTYRNSKEARDRLEYAKKYEKEHKDDPKFRETKRRCSRNAWQRRKIREDVAFLSGIFTDDLSF